MKLKIQVISSHSGRYPLNHTKFQVSEYARITNKNGYLNRLGISLPIHPWTINAHLPQAEVQTRLKIYGYNL